MNIKNMVMLILFIFIQSLFSQNIAISGQVTDTVGIGIDKVQVQLVTVGLSTTTDSNGNFTFLSTKTHDGFLNASFQQPQVVIIGDKLQIMVLPPKQNIHIAIYDCKGSLIRIVLNGQLSAGKYIVNLFNGLLTSKTYLIKVQSGLSATIFRYLTMRGNNYSAFSRSGGGLPAGDAAGTIAKMVAKAAGAIDTLAASKTGYITQKIGIDSFSGNYVRSA